MMAGIWHAYTTSTNAHDYEATLKSDVLPGIKEVRGYLCSYILRRSSGDEVEFVTVLLWESRDALRAFAGPDYGYDRWPLPISSQLHRVEPPSGSQPEGPSHAGEGCQVRTP